MLKSRCRTYWNGRKRQKRDFLILCFTTAEGQMFVTVPSQVFYFKDPSLPQTFTKWTLCSFKLYLDRVYWTEHFGPHLSHWEYRLNHWPLIDIVFLLHALFVYCLCALSLFRVPHWTIQRILSIDPFLPYWRLMFDVIYSPLRKCVVKIYTNCWSYVVCFRRHVNPVLCDPWHAICIS